MFRSCFRTLAVILVSDFGKIQGDGRKFLDHFKSYFGSQLSSQSLNEVHIYQLQLKSATKGDFFHIFCLCFELMSWIANGEQSRQSAARSAALLNKLRQ